MNPILPSLALAGLVAGVASTFAIAQSPIAVTRIAGRSGSEPQLVGSGCMVTSLIDVQPFAFSVGETWRFDGDSWNLLATGGPTILAGHGIASDVLRERIVLFGGVFADGTYSNETWEFNGVSWARITTANAPSPRAEMIVGYDVVGGEVVLFGGTLASGALSAETWTYNGVDWTLRTPAVAPTPRSGATFASSLNGPGLLFGGLEAPDVQSAETWLYAQRNWQLVPGPGPSARYRAAMTFDPVADRFVLVGGERNQFVPFGGGIVLQVDAMMDVWEFDLAALTWSQPTVRGDLATTFDAVAAYDLAKAQVVVRSVLADTSRALRRDVPGRSRSVTVGDGCRSLLNPLVGAELATVGADRPIPGTVVGVRGRNLPAAGTAFLALGLSDQIQGNTPLPAPLSSFGLVGACPLQVSIDAFGVVALANGGFDAALPVPGGSALVGLRVFLQVIAADTTPIPLPLPVLTSNSIELTIGV